MLTAQDVLRNTASEIGDISQDANAIVAKISMVCKQPELADKVRDVFSRLLTMNAEQGRVLANTVDPSALDAACQAAGSCGSHKDIPACKSLLSSDNPEYRARGLQMLDNIVENLASGRLEVGLSVEQTCHVTVDWSSDTPAPWELVRKERDTLLGLVHGYRFLVEANDASMRDVGLTRAQLMRKIRGVELRACLEGTQI